MTTTPSRDPRRRWGFWAGAYTYLVLLAGTNIPTPLYHGYERSFGFGPLTLTLVFAVYVGALIPSLLVVGPLSDAIGRRLVLVPAVCLAMAGSAMFAVAGSTVMLFGARVVQGLALGAASGPVTAVLVEHEPQGDRRRASLVAAVAAVAGVGVGPLFSGLLAQYVPDPTVVPYLVEVALLVPAAAAMATLGDVRPKTPFRPRRPQVPAAIRGPFATAGAASFLTWAVTALFLTLVPSYAAGLANSSNLVVGAGVVAVLFTASAFTQRFTYGRRPATMEVTGLAGLAAGLGLLIGSGVASSLALLVAASAVAGVGQGLAFLGAMTEVNQVAPADRHADVLSSFYVVTYLGTGTPVIAVGFLAGAIGLLPAVEYFAGAVAAACLIVLAILGRRRVKVPSPAPAPRTPLEVPR